MTDIYKWDTMRQIVHNKVEQLTVQYVRRIVNATITNGNLSGAANHIGFAIEQNVRQYPFK